MLSGRIACLTKTVIKSRIGDMNLSSLDQLKEALKDLANRQKECGEERSHCRRELDVKCVKERAFNERGAFRHAMFNKFFGDEHLRDHNKVKGLL